MFIWYHTNRDGKQIVRTYRKYGAPAPVGRQPQVAGWRRPVAAVACPAVAAHCPAAAARPGCASRCVAPTACQFNRQLYSGPTLTVA